MWWVSIGLAILVAVWLFRRRRRAAAPVDSFNSLPTERSQHETIDVAVKRPVLPEGRAALIAASLKAGQEPDESWITEEGNDGLVRLASYDARFLSVAGETFDNPDGVSRQDILRRLRAGAEVYLIPEPTNRFDANAVAVYADLGSGSTGQIGYLTRDHPIGSDVAAGKVIAWLARVGAPRKGAPLGASLYALVHNG